MRTAKPNRPAAVFWLVFVLVASGFAVAGWRYEVVRAVKTRFFFWKMERLYNASPCLRLQQRLRVEDLGFAPETPFASGLGFADDTHCKVAWVVRDPAWKETLVPIREVTVAIGQAPESFRTEEGRGRFVEHASTCVGDLTVLHETESSSLYLDPHERERFTHELLLRLATQVEGLCPAR